MAIHLRNKDKFANHNNKRHNKEWCKKCPDKAIEEKKRVKLIRLRIQKNISEVMALLRALADEFLTRHRW